MKNKYYYWGGGIVLIITISYFITINSKKYWINKLRGGKNAAIPSEFLQRWEKMTVAELKKEYKEMRNTYNTGVVPPNAQARSAGNKYCPKGQSEFLTGDGSFAVCQSGNNVPTVVSTSK